MDAAGLQITTTVSIPASELTFRFSRSSGPGGQNVNKAATRVELLFDLARTPSLSEAQRDRALQSLASHLDSEGVLHLVSQSSRSQRQNREDVVDRFRLLLQQALRPRKRRTPTRPPPQAAEKRLTAKRRRGEIKRLRREARDAG